MTKEDIKTIIDIVHKTIYGFFDVCDDDEETPMTDKDKLLLKINKAICTNIKALEQECVGSTHKHVGNALDMRCDDAISRQAVLDELSKWKPSVRPQEPKTGHWIRWYEQKENDKCIEHIPHCKCSECGKEYDSHSSQFIKYCSECGARMQEVEE